jgi:septum formation protein
MLNDLSGKEHFVVTALTVLDTDTKKIYNDIVKTYVTFCNLSEELINKYIKEKKPLDKAGSYGIQEMGPEFIAKVDGDLENVIGLPTKALKELLIKAGYIF